MPRVLAADPAVWIFRGVSREFHLVALGYNWSRMLPLFHAGRPVLVAGILVSGAAAFAAPSTISFRDQVLPVLEQRCQMCHPADGGQSGLALTSYAALNKGGKHGAAVVPGDPDASLLVKQITGAKPAMPMVGEPLDAGQIELIRRWISEGAKGDTPAGEEGGVWWSFRPIPRSQVPRQDSSWAKTPIDHFVLAKLKEKKLAPSPAADRRTLIRRLSYDLHGLPPRPDEVQAFLNDQDPEAYEKLVDRLLESPRYGERWGRHWLDVVHYGESHGYDKDKARRNSWPYRDYVIRAFNEDKPYKRFVEEQLAGDILFPDDPQGIVSTGFITAGPWDYVGHAELREGTKDKKIARLLDRDDMLAATMSTFVSLTVHCARCHDHKFDPIKQEDYYSLQAVFAGVDRAERPYDQDPETHKKRRRLMSQKRALEVEMQPLLAEGAKVTSAEIKQIDEHIKALSLESADLLPKVGEVDTEQRIERRKEIAKELVQERAKRKKLVRTLLEPASLQKLEDLESQRDELDKVLGKLPEPQLVYTAATYFKTYGKFTPAWKPRPVHLLNRGSVEAPLKPMGPGAISAVEGLDSRFGIDDSEDEGARRVALARWITADDNPLTWRSIVNRVWHYHFGKGIADSPNDFGKMGSLPTHPELLDWLAAEFRDSGGSFKQLHRLILTSAAYRQSSADNARHAKLDAGNQYLWRMNRTRLDAESLRDSVLYVAGRLDLTMGGPSAEHFLFKDDHSPIYDYSRHDFDSAQTRRRGVYRFLVRSVQDPFMESLDCADPSLLVPKRSSTLTAVQALALLNDPLMVRQAAHFAERLRAAGSGASAQINRAHQLAFGRPATPEEIQILADYSTRHGLENLARLILNSNEFMFVD